MLGLDRCVGRVGCMADRIERYAERIFAVFRIARAELGVALVGEGDPLFAPHLLYQSKHGVREVDVYTAIVEAAAAAEAKVA